MVQMIQSLAMIIQLLQKIFSFVYKVSLQFKVKVFKKIIDKMYYIVLILV